MRWNTAGLFVLSCLIASCATAAYVGDPRPGGIAVGPGMTNLNGMSTGPQYQRIRVIAPSGASSCKISGQSWFVMPGPVVEGKPNDQREVMLTYDAKATSASFECHSPSGVVRRTVKTVPYETVVKGFYEKPERIVLLLVKPPLVHMDPKDPEGEARWAALHNELCSSPPEQPSYVCKPGFFEELKAEDLSR